MAGRRVQEELFDGFQSIGRDNFKNPATRDAFLAVARSLAANISDPGKACDALQAVIKYGQAVSNEAYEAARKVIVTDRRAA